MIPKYVFWQDNRPPNRPLKLLPGQVCLRLRNADGMHVGMSSLYAVNADGEDTEGTCLMQFHPDGSIHLCSGVHESANMQLTRDRETVVVYDRYTTSPEYLLTDQGQTPRPLDPNQVTAQ